MKIQCFAKQSFTEQTETFCDANLTLKRDKEIMFLKFLTSVDCTWNYNTSMQWKQKVLENFEQAILGVFNGHLMVFNGPEVLAL